jgi:hypothetical protein
MGRIKHTGMVLMVIAVTVTMLLATALPAMAAPNSMVFFPKGNGATYSCTGGPPFVFDPNSSEGNCGVQQIGGQPTGLTCGVPTEITFVHDGHKDVENAKLCQ